MLAACALVVAALLLAACGNDDTTTTTAEATTTVTTAEGEAAAAGTTTTPDGQVISTAEADSGSDAATAIPDDQDIVSGAQPEIATTTTSTGPEGGVNGVIGEDPNSGVVLSTGSTTTVDPVTGQPVSTAPETVTTTDPDTGEVIVVASAASDTSSTADTTVTTGTDGTATTVTDATTDDTTVTTGADGVATTVTDATSDTTVTTGADGNETTVTQVPASTDSTFSTTTVPLTVDPTLGGNDAILSRPFSPESPWNTSITGDRVDKHSRQWINESRIRVANAADNQSQTEFDVLDNNTNPALKSTRDCKQDTSTRFNGRGRHGHRNNKLNDGRNENSSNCRTINAGLTINVTKWTDPVFSNTQDNAVERIAICRQFNCGPDAVSSVVIPADACPDPRYDGWMTVVDNDSRTALDFWRARCENDGSISYHYVKKWDLDGPGFQKPNGVSARGSGLPLFAGLITPEEIRDGEINHALAISVPGAATRRYVQPASRTDGTGLVTSIPEGARMRLKPGAEKALTKRFVRNKDQRRVARTIITALERYGAIVVDRSAAPTLYAQKNANWTNILPLNLIQQIGLNRFEVTQAGPTFFDPPRVGEGTFDAGTVSSVPSTGSGSQGSEFATPDTNFGQVLP